MTTPPQALPARTAPGVDGTVSLRDAEVGDLDEVLDVRARSFGPTSEADRPAWQRMQERCIAVRRAVVTTSRGRVVGYARINPFGQLWGGRVLPMAGVAGVVVAPEHRGRGVGTQLMRAVLDRCVELGDAVSVLYPATVLVYRRLGWEWGGAQHRVSVDTASLRRLGDVAAVRRMTPDDAAAVAATSAKVHERNRTSGPLVHSVEELREELADADVFAYLVDGADGGVLMYGWHDGDLLVHELTTAGEQATRALWSVVGSGASTARTVYAYQAPRDPLHLLLPDLVRSLVHQERWMLRVLDLAAAVAGRGFPPALHAEATVEVDDPLVPGNTGCWRLRVSGGKGEAEPATVGDGVRVGANGLAALYAGTPIATLRTAGLAAGGESSGDAALDAMFAGEPHLLDYF